MGIKLIVVDIDGTLLNDHLELTNRTAEAIERLRDSGVKTVLATGRNLIQARPVIDKLNIQNPIIILNGACVVHPRNNTIIIERGYNIHEVIPMIDYCRLKDLHFNIHTASEYYVENVEQLSHIIQKEYYQDFMKPKIIKDVQSINQLIMKFQVVSDAKVLDELMHTFQINTKLLRFVRGNEVSLDLLHNDANKGTALKQLAKMENINLDEVAAFGNYLNDLEMIKEAGIGIAMNNAPDLVKESADLITSTNNDDGVAQVLEELV